MNKYLEKIALFGFSKEEKIRNLKKDHQVNVYNHYADHFNRVISNLNDEFEYDGDNGKEYVDHLVKNMKGNKKMYDSYKSIHAKTANKLKEHGVMMADHNTDMDDMVESMGQSYRRALAK
jgi:polyhydroxyalkanoate synthesis regulator phasin